MAINIVIVNYRTASLTTECLASIEPQLGALAGGSVVVVDNCSGDGSMQHLQREISKRNWSSWVDLVASPRNGGFSYGNNIGISRLDECKVGGHENVLLLNPDTTLRPLCLASVCDFLGRHPKAGIIGAPIYDGSHRLTTSAHRWPSPTSELLEQARLGVLSSFFRKSDVSHPPTTQALKCDWVSGAFFLIRKEVLEEIGPMDEQYFLYFEEVDYCLSATQAGWEIWQSDCSGIVHHEGASTGIKEAHRPRPDYWYDSRRRFLVRHLGWSGLWRANFASLLGRSSFVMRRWLKLGNATLTDEQPLNYHKKMFASDAHACWQQRLKRNPQSTSSESRSS